MNDDDDDDGGDFPQRTNHREQIRVMRKLAASALKSPGLCRKCCKAQSNSLHNLIPVQLNFCTQKMRDCDL